jgi:homoserine O-acetyltransferase/O-succinyltransferase
MIFSLILKSASLPPGSDSIHVSELPPTTQANEFAGAARSVGPESSVWRSVWRFGDEPGNRQFIAVGDIPLEVGVTPWGPYLSDVTCCYETWGTLNDDASNAVLVLHGFTADSHASGTEGPGHPEAGWWDGVIGPGKWIDTNKWFVVCPNVLGGCQGSTGPASFAPDGAPWGSRWPVTTIRDMVTVEVALANHLGIRAWHAAVGMSLGGMRALELAIGYPDRIKKAIVIGVGSQATAEQISLQWIQMESIMTDPEWQSGDYYGVGTGVGPVRGMAQARRLGHITYRSELELHQRFGNRPQPGEETLTADRSGRFAVQSYLNYAAVRLERRFDPNTYLAINEAMNHHDVGRGRGGVHEAMQRISADLTIIGLEGDRLYPIRLQRELAFHSSKPLETVYSIVGHDAFLTEDRLTGQLVKKALEDGV